MIGLDFFRKSDYSKNCFSEKGWKYEIATYFGSGNVDLRSGIWMSAAVESVEKLETGKS